jgi:hypothetical protein
MEMEKFDIDKFCQENIARATETPKRPKKKDVVKTNNLPDARTMDKMTEHIASDYVRWHPWSWKELIDLP